MQSPTESQQFDFVVVYVGFFCDTEADFKIHAEIQKG
jgi:hypothetical protein